MKFKLTPMIKVSLAILLLAFSALMLTREGGSSWRTKYAGGKAFPGFLADSVAEIQIDAGKEHVTLERKGPGSWTVKERSGHPADASRIAKTLSAMAAMKSSRQLDELSPNELKEFGLDPESPSGPKLRLYSAAGARVAELTLGRGHFNGGVAPSSPRDMPDGRYCAAAGSHGQGVPLLSSSLFEWLEPKPGLWLEPPSMDMTKALSVSLSASKLPSWSVSRKSPNEPFAFDAPRAGSPSMKMLGPLLAFLSKPRMHDLAPDDLSELSLAETVVVSVALAGGAAADFTFGIGEHRVILKISVAGKPGKWTYDVAPDVVKLLLQPPQLEAAK